MWNWSENQIEIIFFRHGMTIENEQHRYLGSTDASLCRNGICKLQALQKNGTYPKTDILFCSPMKRCMETAEILYPDHKPIYIPEWREMDFGEFEGKNYIELQKDPNYQTWIDSNGTLPFPGGESREAFTKRCEQGFYRMLVGIKGRLLKMDEKQPAPKIVAGAVVHGGTIMAVLSSFCGGEYFDYQVKNGLGYRCLLGGTWEQPELYLLENIPIENA